MTPRQVSWTMLKAFVDARDLSLLVLDYPAQYALYACDGPFELECVLDKTPTDTTALDDFVANYLPASNKRHEQPRDDEGSTLQRPKYAPPGWTYQLRSFEFETSKLGSLVNSKVNAVTKVVTDWGDVTFKLFNAAGTEITDQTVADTDAVWTQADFEPPFDLEIVGGSVRLLQDLSTDVFLWIIGVPDLPEIYGGTKNFVSGVNLDYIAAQGAIDADGRTSKRLNYDATYHTNKMRAIFKHAPGVKHRIMVSFEFYRS